MSGLMWFWSLTTVMVTVSSVHLFAPATVICPMHRLFALGNALFLVGCECGLRLVFEAAGPDSSAVIKQLQHPGVLRGVSLNSRMGARGSGRHLIMWKTCTPSPLNMEKHLLKPLT